MVQHGGSCPKLSPLSSSLVTSTKKTSPVTTRHTRLYSSATPPSGHWYIYFDQSGWINVWRNPSQADLGDSTWLMCHELSASWARIPNTTTVTCHRLLLNEAEMPQEQIFKRKIPVWRTGWMNPSDRLTMSLLHKVKCNVWEQRPR